MAIIDHDNSSLRCRRPREQELEERLGEARMDLYYDNMYELAF